MTICQGGRPIKIKKNINPDIGHRLKLFRSSIKKTQKELESECTVSHSSIVRFEIGSISPSIDYLSFLHKSYGLNIHWVLTGKGEMVFNEKSEQTIVDPNIPQIEGEVLKITDDEYRQNFISLILYAAKNKAYLLHAIGDYYKYLSTEESPQDIKKERSAINA